MNEGLGIELTEDRLTGEKAHLLILTRLRVHSQEVKLKEVGRLGLMYVLSKGKTV